jgi:hypothetical protein
MTLRVTKTADELR